MSNQSAVVVREKAELKRVGPRTTRLQQVSDQRMRRVAQVERRSCAIDDASDGKRKIIASPAHRYLDADARIPCGRGLDDSPRMQQEPSAPFHRVDLRGDFRRHPMPMNLPIGIQMPQKAPAFSLRSAR